MNAVDTSVLIHAYDLREPHRRPIAVHLIETLSDGVTLWQVACEFMAASRRIAGTGFTPEIAWQRLSEVLALQPLVVPTPMVLNRARELTRERQFQFWDALIFAACIEAEVDTLYSADIPGAAVPGLTITNLFS